MKCKFILKITLFKIFILYPTLLFASDLKDVDNNLSGPLEMVIYLLFIVSFLLAFGFALSSIFLFKKHRENPVQAPLSQVIFSVIMSLISLSLPLVLGPYSGYNIFSSAEITPSDTLLLPGQRSQEETNPLIQDTLPQNPSENFDSDQDSFDVDDSKRNSEERDNDFEKNEKDKRLWEY